jgi:hypothetical protein
VIPNYSKFGATTHGTRRNAVSAVCDRREMRNSKERRSCSVWRCFLISSTWRLITCRWKSHETQIMHYCEVRGYVKHLTAHLQNIWPHYCTHFHSLLSRSIYRSTVMYPDTNNDMFIYNTCVCVFPRACVRVGGGVSASYTGCDGYGRRRG